MKKVPNYTCPYCGKKHFTRDQAMTCASADILEELAKNRRLRKITNIKNP